MIPRPGSYAPLSPGRLPSSASNRSRHVRWKENAREGETRCVPDYMNTEKALITGASSGIGLHLAREFAKHQHPLVLVAPVESELRRVASELENEFGVKAQAIAADLEKETAAQELFDQFSGGDNRIDILVNNAGHGQRGKFWEIDIERDLSILRLNVEALLRLTKLFLRPMLSRGHGRILNVASIAGFEPGPELAVYHASKAFVLSLSEALAEELPGPNRHRLLRKGGHGGHPSFSEGKPHGATTGSGSWLQGADER